MRTKTHSTELQLILKEVEDIDYLINDAQELVTWQSEGRQKLFDLLLVGIN